MIGRRNEDLYWSSSDEDVQELRAACRLSYVQFGADRKLRGAGLYPLIDCEVLVTRAGEPGKIVQVFALENTVRVIVAQGTPLSRVLTIPPEEVLLPWLTEHRPHFDRAGRRSPAKKASLTASSATSTSNPAAPLAKPTAVPTGELAGPMSLPL